MSSEPSDGKRDALPASRRGVRRRDVVVLAGSGALLAACASTPEAASVADAEAPPPPQVPLRRVGLVSCVDQTKPQPLWDAVLVDKPDLMIFGGDNVYSSETPWSLSKLKEAYALQAAVPNFAKLRRSVPHLAIWDDNDYGSNDGGAEFPFKQASKAAFLEFWDAEANDPRRFRDALYHAQVYGPPGRRVQVILLDTRWYRSPWKPTDVRGAPGKERYLPDFDGEKTMLGDVQWAWLAEQLKVPAEVRLIVSGTQVWPDGHGWERWGNFPFELSRLGRLVTVSRAGGVVFLSGDRHFGAIYRETRGAVPYPFHELTASGVTHTYRDVKEAGPNRLGEPFADLHYGLVDIDWSGRRVVLQVKDAKGGPQRAHVIPFSEIQVNA